MQAEAFLDAVRDGDPGRVLSSYADALLTDRLTRSVVCGDRVGRLDRASTPNRPKTRDSLSTG